MTTSAPAPAGAPDLAWPVVGFRQWRLVGGVLKSMFVAGDWLEAEQRARCYAGRHDDAEVPAKECSCGIYAYYDQVPRMASAGTRELVAGVVVLWGQIELHATGMRAEHARLVALELPISRGRKRRDLVAAAERLSVAVVPHRRLRASAEDDGLPIGPELRPRASLDPYQHGGTLPSVPWEALAPERRKRYRRRIIPRG
ncbi:MAG TPA: hypothetical protein VGI87_10145 [Solirubrobacteraceae bacterium]|jgi:hypothetical protein